MREHLTSKLKKENWLNSEETVRFKVKVKSYNLKELCSLYGLSRKLLNAKLKSIEKEIGEKQGYFYTVLQVETIFKLIGIPYEINER